MQQRGCTSLIACARRDQGKVAKTEMPLKWDFPIIRTTAK
jgi:hypothetical protein